MDVDVTPLDFEVQRVLDNPVQSSYFDYTAQFKIGDQYLSVLRVKDCDERHDYQTDVGPDMSIVVLVGMGDLSTVIFPNRDNLELVLTREELNPNTSAPSFNEGSILTQTFIAKIDPAIRPYGAESNDPDLPRETLNLTELVEVRVALKPKILEEVAKTPVGGPFRGTTTAALLRSLLKYYTDMFDLADEDKLLGINVNMEQASQEVRGTIAIPHGTPLIDLADVIQNQAGGIYPTGLGQFIHNQIWHVFPLFDTTRFDESLDKVVLVLVSQKRYPILEKTYIKENNVTTILITGEKKFQSDKENVQQVDGNGVMFTDAKEILNGFTEKRGGITMLNRGKANNEFIGEVRKDGRNIVRKAPEEITDNPFPIMSRLARGQGHTILVTWRNADPRVLKPGMAIRTLYLNDGDIASIDGVLIGSHTQVRMKGTGAIANGFEVVVSMFIYVRSTAGSNDFIGMN